jgi:hypothetical protein
MEVRPVGTDCFIRADGQTKHDEADSRFSEFGLKTTGDNTDSTKQIRGENSCAVGNLREYNGGFKFLGFAIKRHWGFLFNWRCLIFMEVITCSTKVDKGGKRHVQ